MSKPVIHKIVFKHYGEIASTPRDVFCPLEKFDPARSGDLNQKVRRLVDFDNWGNFIEVNLYEVRSITLPDWLTPQEYCKDYTKWEKMPVVLGDDAFKWSELHVRKIMHMEQPLRELCLTLLNTKQFRSPFRESCCRQLREWLNNPNPQYDSPFSQRQLSALLPPRRYR